MDQILKAKKKKKKVIWKKSWLWHRQKLFRQTQKGMEDGEKNIIISPSIAPGIKIIE